MLGNLDIVKSEISFRERERERERKAKYKYTKKNQRRLYRVGKNLGGGNKKDDNEVVMMPKNVKESCMTYIYSHRHTCKCHITKEWQIFVERMAKESAEAEIAEEWRGMARNGEEWPRMAVSA